jgi:hypothetical protein
MNGPALERAAAFRSDHPERDHVDRRRRRRRTARAPADRPRIQERDLWILEALETMPFLGTSALGTLLFRGSRPATNKRMRRLVNVGAVRVWVEALHRENRYSLASGGWQILEKVRGETLVHRVPRGLPADLEHRTLINDLRIRFALELPGAGAELLSWRSDWDLREVRSRGIVPDALFQVAWVSRRWTFALEADNHMKSPRRFLLKILRYQSRHVSERLHHGSDGLILLAVSREPKWAERYRATVGEQRCLSVWFSDRTAIEAGGVTGCVWRRPGLGTIGPVTLGQILPPLPYGKEGAGTVSP